MSAAVAGFCTWTDLDIGRGAPKLVSERRMQDAVDILLGMQNSDGGFASYELIRGPGWLEWLNSTLR